MPGAVWILVFLRHFYWIEAGRVPIWNPLL